MHRTRQSGFTLVELMVTVAVVAILAAIAFPSFQGTFRSTRTSTATNEFLGSIALARTEAMRSVRGGGLCAANASGSACSDVTDWSNGWLIWTDANATPGYQAGTDTLVRYVQPKKGVVITVAAAGAENSILFNSRGVGSNTVIVPSRAITLKPSGCPAGEKVMRSVILTRVGQADVQVAACP